MTYLIERKQFVIVHGIRSTTKVIDSGIPQGSNLEPLLFFLFFNYLNKSSEVLNFLNFADDTTVFLSHRDSDTLYDSFNDKLSKISEWLKVNRLSLNVDKTCYMIISNKKVKKKRIEIPCKPIKLTDNVKFLGVLINDKLSFEKHVSYLQKQEY